MTPPDEPINDDEGDVRPIVALPRPGLPGAAIALIAAVVALALFVALDARRRHATSTPRRADVGAYGAFPAPPPLIVPPEPPPAPTKASRIPIVTQAAPLALAPIVRPSRAAPIEVSPVLPAPPPIQPFQPQSQIEPRTRLNEPALVYDNGPTESASAGPDPSPPGRQGGAAPAGTSDDAPVRATLIRNRTTVIPTGTLIPAVLETPIDSARPGLVRAVVSENARGFDGRRVLVPRGSRLIGEYQSDVRSGQDRVLITWTRLIRPDGAAIRIGSPAADALGGAGVRGRVNTFFFQRFASAVLQSALQVGVNLASRPGNGSVIVGLPSTTAGTVGQTLLPGNDLRPKIKVRQGALVNVFVARDLDFSSAPLPPEEAGR